jgi:hypothetical protein
MIAKANNMIMDHRHSSQGDDCNARSRLPRLIGLRVLTWQPVARRLTPGGFFFERLVNIAQSLGVDRCYHLIGGAVQALPRRIYFEGLSIGADWGTALFA